MKKELLMILFILGLPTIFIMSMEPYSTGAAVNEFAQLRMERIQLYLSFPDTTSHVHKTLVFSVRQGILAGAHEDFYYPYGLNNGDQFFLNELALFQQLLKLMCLQPTDTPYAYISPQGIPVHLPGNLWDGIMFTDLGQIPCNPSIQQDTQLALASLADLDIRLVEQTVAKSTCPENSQDSMQRARDNYVIGNYEAFLTNLHGAWSATCA